MESADSSAGSQQPNLPPGFRFHPTDEELVVHYLKKKAASAPLPVSIIAEIELYKFDPWELPAKATFGEVEWYFFTPRDRKYPNGARPNRAATSGYWKATGTDKPILTSGGTQKVGVKKALVFYEGKPPKGIKTSWVMHEYRIADHKPSSKPPGFHAGHNKGSLRLDDWVLCRIYKKNSAPRPVDHEMDDSMCNMLSTLAHPNPKLPPQLKATSYSPMLENAHNMLDEMLGNQGSNNHHAGSLSMVTSGTSNALPLKRALPSVFWADEDEGGTKRFNEGTSNGSLGRTDDQNLNSIATLLSQIPQATILQQQTAVGAVGDGVFQQQYQLHGLSWYSN
ncbi:hypothetical protein RHMOL_Rhmol04G0035100 [Rhododendron molle]|uniref:Uncharacterized protein n=1 Tax=Rhododendron molle TaxID=49168 RepID=A0ACC0NXY8_RHOML|nr:hypothetical protein RHMOL_Rhmol04G0035100 [Rhododendron molle]